MSRALGRPAARYLLPDDLRTVLSEPGLAAANEFVREPHRQLSIGSVVKPDIYSRRRVERLIIASACVLRYVEPSRSRDLVPGQEMLLVDVLLLST